MTRPSNLLERIELSRANATPLGEFAFPPPTDMRPEAVAAYARTYLDHYGLRDWTFGFNRRVRGLGLCIYAPKRIELSAPYVANNTPERIRNTLVHEIAHALSEHGVGHGSAWVRLARSMGCDGKPCTEAEAVNMPAGRWECRCTGACGLLCTMHRRPKVEGKRFRCPKCRSRVLHYDAENPGVPLESEATLALTMTSR